MVLAATRHSRNAVKQRGYPQIAAALVVACSACRFGQWSYGIFALDANKRNKPANPKNKARASRSAHAHPRTLFSREFDEHAPKSEITLESHRSACTSKEVVCSVIQAKSGSNIELNIVC